VPGLEELVGHNDALHADSGARQELHDVLADGMQPHALFHEDITDVVVCDGFVGNIVLKQAESIYSISKKLNISHPFFDRLNFENIGGTPIVGINANVVIGHGISERKAIVNMVLQTRAVIRANLAQKIIEAI
jgi:glycerol-3-phosphate acyltransferase PlsX